MEDKFEINSEEVIRILSLHEDATKNQYLNVLNEQSHSDWIESNKYILKNNITLKNVNISGPNLTLLIGFYFQGGYGGVTGRGKIQLRDKTNYGSVEFKCSTGKFSILNGNGQPENKEIWYDNTKVLSSELVRLCGDYYFNYSVKSINGLEFSDKNGNNTFSIRPGELIKYFKDTSKARVLSSAKNSYITFSCPNNFNAEFLTKNKEVINIIPKNKETLTFFQKSFCGTKPKTQELQTTTQKPVVKPPTTKKLVSSTKPKTQELQTTTQKPITRQTQQQFIQQVSSNNKLIQTSLGVQQPTGQLTTADIDAIMIKLG
jgi:hypothetical protein